MMRHYDCEQLRAIDASGGYYLVLAPPGCGKTDILSERVVRAAAAGVDFADMLCLTFTNRASRGMRDRVRQKVGADAGSIFVGNVHRYCSGFIYANAIVPENSAIIDEDDMGDIMAEYDRDFFLKRGGADRAAVTLVDNVDGYLSQRRLGHPDSAIYLPADDFEAFYDIARDAGFDSERVNERLGTDHKAVKYALRFQEYKRERNVISFSDILIYAYEALRRDVDRRFKRYKWVQVDEVQDLNALQTAIVDELLDDRGPFTVMYLGDEQQAIFSFLGAKLDQLARLKGRCAGHVLTLGNNYRSPDYLLEVFNTYAVHELGVDPDLLPQPTRREAKDKLDLILTGNPDPVSEDERVEKMIEYYLAKADERVAILVPTNASADKISDRLTRANIPHFKISGRDMFKTQGYKMLSSLFCVMVNEFNFLAWSRLLCGIGAMRTGTDARELINEMKRLMLTPSDLLGAQSYIERFNDVYVSREMVFFDTETTGLDVFRDDIVQIAAFKVNKGERVPDSEFNIFLETDLNDIPPRLGDKMNPLVEAYARASHVDRRIGLRMFLDYVGDCPVLGHNVNYDYRILKSNVERYLDEEITLDTYDSLRLIKCVEPDLRMYKLEFLLKELRLEGKNSHLADEDVAATKALVDYCFGKSQAMIQRQRAFCRQRKTQNVAACLRQLAPIIEDLQSRLYQPCTVSGRTARDELKSVYDQLRSLNLIDDLGFKFEIFLNYVQNEWIGGDDDKCESIYDQIRCHITDIASSINEGDLVNSQDLVTDKVFVMTVYKGKGLEFDNVVVLGADDGVYPYYQVNRVLNDPDATAEQRAKALSERKEDARKFYVALSRAKKRLCVSYTRLNQYGFSSGPTPFLKSIAHYFYTGQRHHSS